MTGALTVQGDLTTTGAGTINGRNVAADGAKLDSHLANKTNPHGVTSQQIGAAAHSRRHRDGLAVGQGHNDLTG